MMKKSTHSKRRGRGHVVLMLLVIITTVMITSHIESHYTREAMVQSMEDNTVVFVDNMGYTREAMVQSMEDNTVVFVDNMGYTWEATDVENITEGQMVELKMFTNHTNDIIHDDIIKSIKPTAIRMN